MACPSCDVVANGQAMPPPWRNLQVVASALSGLLLAIGFFGSMLGLSPMLETSLYLLAVVIGGWYFIREGVENLLQERQIGIEILMTVAAITAGLLGQWGGGGRVGAWRPGRRVGLSGCCIPTGAVVETDFGFTCLSFFGCYKNNAIRTA